MNFTYLLEGPCEPGQELLQKYNNYIVIVVLSDAPCVRIVVTPLREGNNSKQGVERGTNAPLFRRT